VTTFMEMFSSWFAGVKRRPIIIHANRVWKLLTNSWNSAL
jgi:hypothetical protein